MTVIDVPPVAVDWQQQCLAAEQRTARLLRAVETVCWELEGIRYAPTYGLAAKRVRAAVAAAEEETDA